MAVEKQEIETYFGKCKCCLNYGYLRTMWEEHVVEDQTEIYGQMLTQCFSISWTIQETEDDDQICEDCIWKLREAYMFKKQVLKNQKQLEQVTEEDVIEDNAEVKQEPEDYVVEYLDEEILEKHNVNNDDSDEESLDEQESQDGVSLKDEEDYENYDENQDPLDEDDEDFEPETTTPRKRKPRQRESASESDSDAPKPKWPKKLPVDDRNKTYKQYIEDDLKKAVDAVIGKRMNQRAASKHYRIPRKTLSAKVRAFKNNKDVYPKTHTRQFIQEIKTLLTHINLTPFRSRANTPCCFYCKDHKSFPSPEDLRAHTQHHDRTTYLEIIMRPSWNHETIKLDLKDAFCIKCNTPLPNWADMLDHLNTNHGITLAYQNKMIPYILDANICVFCDKNFSAFMLLDAHLNTHLQNYMCGHCGEPFITDQRLRAHEKIHETGRYPCHSCDKVFTLEKYMKKHAVSAHTDQLKVKCYHCSEIFKSEHQRQAHIVNSHKEHVNYITCELCGTVFDWMRNFMRHMKRAHDSEYPCDQCGKFFASKKLLREHELKHTGDKQFKCLVCFKKYYSLTSMRSHLKYAHKNVTND